MFHILMALADEDRHGYGIIQEVLSRTNDEVRLSPGTLYRSIQRMLEDELIVEVSERPAPELDDERRRYYRKMSPGQPLRRRRESAASRRRETGPCTSRSDCRTRV